MEQVSVALSEKLIVTDPLTKDKNRLSLTKEAILSLNDGTVSFEEARALFNVDLSTFLKILEQFNIFVWKKGDRRIHGIHGGDYPIRVVIKDMRANNYICSVPSTSSFEAVRSIIEEDLKLSPGCYKLTFKHRNIPVGSVSVMTDRDWHSVVLFSRRRAYFVFLDLEDFPSSPTADEVACDEDRFYMNFLYEVACDEDRFYRDYFGADASDEDASDEDASDDDASDDDASDVCCDKYVTNVFLEGACDENLMEQVSVPLSEKTIVTHPLTKEKIRLPLTKETILSLNDGTVSFEEARALFNVDLLTFKSMLAKLNIFVWKELDGSLLRIHGGDYAFKVVIKDMRGHYAVKAKYYYTVPSTLSFEAVKSMIEENLKLSPGCYKLTFKHPIKSIGNVWVKTDRDWHFVVLSYILRGYTVYLDLEVFPSS